MAEALTKAGRYQIVGELGRGSMGVVYQGFDPIIGRTVAIKTMLPENLSPEEFREYKARFQREAQAAGILAHPNIITVYDFGEDNGVLYLAMEYLEGKSLEKIVQEQTVLPIETIVPIYDQVCSALDHAHRGRIVHRDIKPANIMILHNGLVKVTDFGIAKMMAMGMTQAGQILGTPNYMSPEQVKGRQIDGRSDIFSLGVILYELVTGEKPFGGQNITTVIYKIINENPIAPRELDASIHAGLSYVICKALAKNPDERYQTCGELAEDLRNYRNLGGASFTGQGTVILTAPVSRDETDVPPSAPYAVASPPRATRPTQAVPPAAVQPAPRATQMAARYRIQTAAAPPEPPAVTLDETPIGDPLNTPVPPLVQRQQPVPQIVWVIGALLLVALMGAMSYIFMLRPRTQPVTTVHVTAPAATPPVQSPVPVASQTPQAPPPAAPEQTTLPPPVAAAPPATPKETKTDVVPKAEVTHPATPKLGQLTVSSNIAGAKISIDGRSDPSWITPYTFPDIPAGTHNIQVSMDGYDTFLQSVGVPAGDTAKVMANLSQPSAELTIKTDPPGLEIVIDGKSYGPSPAQATLPAGSHTYVIKPATGSPYQNTVTLRGGDIMTKTIRFASGTP